MSLASLPADVVWNLTKYVLRSYNGPVRPGDEGHGRVVDLVRCLSTDKAARTLYDADPRFKGLLFCTLEYERGWYNGDTEPRTRPPDAWRRDRAVVLSAVKVDGEVLLQADARFLDDKQIVVAALHNESCMAHPDDRIYVRLPETLRLDHEVARVALRKVSTSLFGLHDEETIARTVPPAVRDDKRLLLSVMRGDNFMSLAVASERLRDDRDVVLLAVQQKDDDEDFPPSIKFASAALRDDRAIVESSIRTRGGFVCLAHASERLRDDMDLALFALSCYEPSYDVNVDEGYDFLSARIRSDRKLFLELVAAADHPKTKWPQDSGECFEPSRVRFLLRKAAPALQRDKSVVLAAVRRDGHALLWASDDLKDDYDVVHAACSNERRALGHASVRLRDDQSLQEAAGVEPGEPVESDSDYE